MREIIFRGKTRDGKWVYGLPVPVEINTYPTDGIVMVKKLAFDELDAWDFEFEEVLPETVGRCTGIPDGNNRKMYDGDLCCFSIFPGRDDTLVKISYRYGTPGYEPVFPEQVHPDDREWKSFYRHEEREMISPHYFRVIGNIHDNPEFLEVEHWKD